MKKRPIFVILIILVLTVNLGSFKVEASEPFPSRQVVFSQLENAFKAQVSLSEQFRKLEEVKGVLSPYFEQPYLELFLKENLFEEEAGFIVYGSDFAMYYIPFFSYDDETKVLYDNEENKIYVYQHFEGRQDGPITYDNHYEIITLAMSNKDWKISNLLIDSELPQRINELEEQSNDDSLKQQVGTNVYKQLFVTNTFTPFRFLQLFSLLEMEYKNQLFSYSF